MSKTRKLTLTSMSIALGVILPQAFHMVPNAGTIFLPMHIPVLIGGFTCGPLYGLLIGFITPIISHIIFTMPPVVMLSQMIIELSMYGFLTGLFNKYINVKNEYVKTYICLILAMLIGRLTYGMANALFFKAGTYSLNIWLTTAFITALPGILIQLIVVPIIVVNANKLNN